MNYFVDSNTIIIMGDAADDRQRHIGDGYTNGVTVPPDKLCGTTTTPDYADRI